MITKYIQFLDKKTSDFKLRLIDDIELTAPERAVDLVEIDGANGAKINDKKRLNVISKNFPFVVYDHSVDPTEVGKQLTNWLYNAPVGWHDLVLSWDSNYIYKAVFFESFNLTGSLKSYKKCVLNFKVHPVKYLKSGLHRIDVSNGQTIVNPENRPSKPLIKLIGTGDVDVRIAGQLLRLKGVMGHIVIDCETESAYYDNSEPQYDKMYSYPFPVLKTGHNLIQWNNNNFTMSIVPRWEAIVI